MQHKQFIAQLDEPKILEAIKHAEAKTSGEVRVFIASFKSADPLADAEKQFARLGCAKTRHRNAILLFIAPASQNFAIFGDVGVHQKVGAEFWSAVRDEVEPRFKTGDFTGAIVHAIQKAGQLLAVQFPIEHDDKNELPDRIERG